MAGFESAYVALSRMKQHVQVYTDNRQGWTDAINNAVQKGTAHDVLEPKAGLHTPAQQAIHLALPVVESKNLAFSMVDLLTEVKSFAAEGTSFIDLGGEINAQIKRGDLLYVDVAKGYGTGLLVSRASYEAEKSILRHILEGKEAVSPLRLPCRATNCASPQPVSVIRGQWVQPDTGGLAVTVKSRLCHIRLWIFAPWCNKPCQTVPPASPA